MSDQDLKDLRRLTWKFQIPIYFVNVVIIGVGMNVNSALLTMLGVASMIASMVLIKDS